MKLIWRRCESILFLMAFMISSVPTPSEGIRRSLCLSPSQIEGPLKKFRTSGGLSYEAKLKQLTDCLNRGSGECSDPSLRSMVTNEILLRGQMREMGEDCTSDGKYRKPFDGANLERSEGYEPFQEELLASGLTFCNPFKHLSCSPQKKCECGPGTALRSEVNPNVCTLIVGGYCQKEIPLFDPFNSDSIRFGDSMTIPALECSEGELSCRIMEFSNRDVCVDNSNATVELDKKLLNYFKNLPRLSFGDPCNSEHHDQLLKLPEAETEWADYRMHLKKLEDFMDAKTQFCDLGRILVCGNSSRKCECIKPAFYDENIKSCNYKHPQEACTQGLNIEEFALSLTFNANRELNDGQGRVERRVCKAGCYFIQDSFPSRSICWICPDFSNRIGRNCDKNLTSFLLRGEIVLAMDEPDWGKQIDLLTQLSDKGTELEKVTRLEIGSPCDMEGELEGGQTIRRIRALNVGEVVATREYYKETIRLVDNIILKYNTRGLCRFSIRRGFRRTSPTLTYRPDLVCGPIASNATCYEPDGDEYSEILRKRLIPFQTLPHGQPCPYDLDQLFRYAKDRFGNDRLRLNELLFEIFDEYLRNKVQLCNTTAGLECKFPSGIVNVNSILPFKKVGKCGFSDEKEEEKIQKQKVVTKKSGVLRANSPQFIHLSFLVILFTLH